MVQKYTNSARICVHIYTKRCKIVRFHTSHIIALYFHYLFKRHLCRLHGERTEHHEYQKDFFISIRGCYRSLPGFVDPLSNHYRTIMNQCRASMEGNVNCPDGFHLACEGFGVLAAGVRLLFLRTPPHRCCNVTRKSRRIRKKNPNTCIYGNF